MRTVITVPASPKASNTWNLYRNVRGLITPSRVPVVLEEFSVTFGKERTHDSDTLGAERVPEYCIIGEAEMVSTTIRYLERTKHIAPATAAQALYDVVHG